MKDALVSGPLHDPKMEAKAADALKQQAYASAYDRASAEIDEAPKAMHALPGIEKRLEALEGRSTNITVQTPKPAKVKPTQNRPNVVDMTCGLMAAELLRRNKRGTFEDNLQLALPGEANDLQRRMVGSIYKASTSGATTTASGFAAELVSTGRMPGSYYNQLENVSIVGTLMSRGIVKVIGEWPGNLNGLSMPHRDRSKPLTPAWIAEGATLQHVQGQFGSAILNRYKTGCVTSFSNELLKVSVPSIVEALRDAILMDSGEMIDAAFLSDADGQTALSPAGIWHDAPSQAATGIGTTDDVLADLRWILSTLIGARARDAVLIVNPLVVASLKTKVDGSGNLIFRKELEAGELMGLPLIVSANCPVDQVFALSGFDVHTWLGAPEFDLSDQATIVMLNADGTDPTMSATGKSNAVDGGGSVDVSDAATVTGGPAHVLSMFQMNSTALRFIQPLSFLRRGAATAGTACKLTGVVW